MQHGQGFAGLAIGVTKPSSYLRKAVGVTAFVSLSVCLCVCLSLRSCVSASLSLYLSIASSDYLCRPLSVSLSYLSLSLSTSLIFLCLCFCVLRLGYLCLSLCPFVWLSVCLPVVPPPCRLMYRLFVVFSPGALGTAAMEAGDPGSSFYECRRHSLGQGESSASSSWQRTSLQW